LDAEIDNHLSGEDSAGNMRNGYGRKTVMTDTGKISIEAPRDRQATFDPQLIAKYQRCLPSFDQKIVSMYARGMINTICPCRSRLCGDVPQIAGRHGRSGAHFRHPRHGPS
jgi:hypothetical protein